MNIVTVGAGLLRWARERVGYTIHAPPRGFPRTEAWEDGQLNLTLGHFEGIAKATHIACGVVSSRSRQSRAHLSRTFGQTPTSV